MADPVLPVEPTGRVEQVDPHVPHGPRGGAGSVLPGRREGRRHAEGDAGERPQHQEARRPADRGGRAHHLRVLPPPAPGGPGGGVRLLRQELGHPQGELYVVDVLLEGPHRRGAVQVLQVVGARQELPRVLPEQPLVGVALRADAHGLPELRRGPPVLLGGAGHAAREVAVHRHVLDVGRLVAQAQALARVGDDHVLGHVIRHRTRVRQERATGEVKH
mmetsp:Transcript_95452/g.270216  ORF Transcript_95452/g.270216 Transcript_95452/m.270216 type:complete len:218 (+) Transcript_95452:456-1109(+)